jgi:DNA replicative helicase MCM subunit Mcm2 (Cdc46/Mcm family)
MSRYGVIVCPKCREHAQIIEIAARKTTQCQRCSSILKNMKRRHLFSSDKLDEAVSVRTQIQAKLHDGNAGIEDVFNGKGFINAFNGLEETEISMSDFVDRRENIKPTKNLRQLILATIQANGGKTEIEKLREIIVEQEIEEDKFEMMLEKMMHSGEIYIPSSNIIQLV